VGGKDETMLVYEYKLDGAASQYVRIDEAIRVAQFVRNKALRLWMDADRAHPINANDLQIYCSQLAKDFTFAASLNSQARQASADRAWFAISRFYAACKAKAPGKKGYPRFQHDNRSVEYKVTGWKLDSDGKHITFTDGCGIGRLRLIGTQEVALFPLSQVKRARIVRRAKGYYAQFCIDAERQVEHQSTGQQVGIDMGLKEFYTDSQGQTVHNPRFLRKAEGRLKYLQRQVSRKSNHTKDHRKPYVNHQSRHRQNRSRYPRQTPQEVGPATELPAKRPQSHNYHKARKNLACAHLKVQRQREDSARKTASALVSSHDVIAYEDLQIPNMVKNHALAKSISDAAWALFLRWVQYYATLHGIPFIAVPPQFTSQMCSGCGRLVRKSLSTRTHVCVHCGLVLDRDENAARNILAAGRQKQFCTVGQTGTGPALTG
jgi:putative transposase